MYTRLCLPAFTTLLTNRPKLLPEWHSWPAKLRADPKKYATIAIPLPPFWLRWRVNNFLISLVTHSWPNAPILHHLSLASWVCVRSIILCSKTSFTQIWDFLCSKREQRMSKQIAAFILFIWFYIAQDYHGQPLSRSLFFQYDERKLQDIFGDLQTAKK